MEVVATARIFELIEKLSKEQAQSSTSAAPTPLPRPVIRINDGRPTSAKATVGRNDPCVCGSGKKWKNCGLKNTEEHQRLMAGGK